MSIGFTGTRQGLTLSQMAVLTAVLEEHYRDGEREFHHGGCKGADAQASVVADAIGYEPIVVHPADDVGEVWVGKSTWTHRWEPAPALARNHDIVDCATAMVACPGGPERRRGSGTWATIRYAKTKRRPLTTIWPDGRREET